MEQHKIAAIARAISKKHAEGGTQAGSNTQHLKPLRVRPTPKTKVQRASVAAPVSPTR